MAVALFLILHAFKQLNSDFDSYWICLLVAVDSLTAVQVLRWRAYLKR